MLWETDRMRDKMEFNKERLLKCILVPVVAGGIAGFLSGGGMKEFAQLNQPPLSPPGWLFPIVWTILYVLMGVSSYLILNAETDKNKFVPLVIYVIQLFVNVMWPIFFFGFGIRFFALLWLILLWILVFWMIKKFREISKLAAKLCVPYLIWLTFAAYLNLGVWWLNR